MEARSRSHMVVIGDERGPETQSCAVLPSPCGAGAGPFPPLCGKGGDLALLRNCADVEPRRWVREDVMKQPRVIGREQFARGRTGVPWHPGLQEKFETSSRGSLSLRKESQALLGPCLCHFQPSGARDQCHLLQWL